jgi:hypothetical protein
MISSLYSSILRRQPRTAHCSWLARVRRIAQVRRFRMFFRPEPLKGPTMRADFMFGFHYLVGGSTPLKNMSSSVGMMTFPIYIYIWMEKYNSCSKPPTSQCSPHSRKPCFRFFSYYESVIGVPEAVGCDPNFRVCGPGKGPGPRRERIQGTQRQFQKFNGTPLSLDDLDGLWTKNIDISWNGWVGGPPIKNKEKQLHLRMMPRFQTMIPVRSRGHYNLPIEPRFVPFKIVFYPILWGFLDIFRCQFFEVSGGSR